MFSYVSRSQISFLKELDKMVMDSHNIEKIQKDGKIDGVFLDHGFCANELIHMTLFQRVFDQI